MELGRSKTFEDHHGAATFRTAPKRAWFLGCRCLLFHLRLWNRAEKSKAKWQESGAAAVGKEAEVADADEAFGQRMQQEAAQKLSSRDRVINLCSLL